MTLHYESLQIDTAPAHVSIRPRVFTEVQEVQEPIHLILIGTKPDIIKQAPLINELKRQNKCVLVVHSGQHYDWNLSGGLEQEFSIVPDFNLNVRGSLYEQQSQIIARIGLLLEKFKKMKKTVIPYTYGDTTTAVAGGIASYLNEYSIAHVEAGLRTMTPEKRMFLKLLAPFDVQQYVDELRTETLWQKGSYEPFPEQFDTRASAPSAGVHLTPTALNEKHLLDEGYAPARVFTVGNPVADAIRETKKRMSESTIFQQYPRLEEGNFIRFCIHRRENISSKHRFSVLIKTMMSLVEKGENILFISLNSTEKALQEFGFLEKVRLLASKHANFIYSSVWPYYRDVITAMTKCRSIATDSGSIQEETNILGIPGIVLRFNSDRPEAIFAGANVLAPPITSSIVEKIISAVQHDDTLRKSMMCTKSLYGEDVSKKMVGIVDKIAQNESLFELFEHERLGFHKLDFWEDGKLDW